MVFFYLRDVLIIFQDNVLVFLRRHEMNNMFVYPTLLVPPQILSSFFFFSIYTISRNKKAQHFK